MVTACRNGFRNAPCFRKRFIHASKAQFRIRASARTEAFARSGNREAEVRRHATFSGRTQGTKSSSVVTLNLSFTKMVGSEFQEGQIYKLSRRRRSIPFQSSGAEARVAAITCLRFMNSCLRRNRLRASIDAGTIAARMPNEVIIFQKHTDIIVQKEIME